MKSNYLTSLILLLVFLTSITLEAASIKKKERRFGSTLMTFNNPHFIELNNGLKKIIEANGDKLISLDPELNNSKQIAIVEDLISRKVDAIFLNPVDWKGIKPALESAKKAGIPIFVVDAPVFDDTLVITTIASDNQKAGELCAKHLIEKMKITKGNIVLIEHPEAKSAIERINGFIDYIKAFPDLKIVARGYSEGQLEKSMSVMEKILDSGVEIAAVMALNDPSALGVIAALEKRGKRGSVKAIYGVDGSADALTMIKAGKLTATAAQSPKEIGKTAALSAYNYFEGKKINHDIKIPVKLIVNLNSASKNFSKH